MELDALVEICRDARGEAKYPTYHIQSRVNLTEDQMWDFMLKIDRTVSGIFDGHLGNLHPAVPYFRNKSGYYDFMMSLQKKVTELSEEKGVKSKKIARKADRNYFFHSRILDAIGHISLNSFYHKCIVNAIVGTPTTIFDYKTGNLNGFLGAYGKWQSGDEIAEDIYKLAQVDYLDVTFRFFDGDGYDSEGDMTNYGCKLQLHIHNGQIEVEEPTDVGENQSRYSRDQFPEFYEADKKNDKKIFFFDDRYKFRLPYEFGVSLDMADMFCQKLKEKFAAVDMEKLAKEIVGEFHFE